MAKIFASVLGRLIPETEFILPNALFPGDLAPGVCD
jgi:hypothetical protein